MRYSRPGGTPKSRNGGGTAGARDVCEEDGDTPSLALHCLQH